MEALVMKKEQININQYFNLIYKVVTKFPSEHQGDLFNECYIQLDAISKRYKNGLGTFEGFAYKRLLGACMDFISNENQYITSLDDYINTEEEYHLRKSELIEDDSTDVEAQVIDSDFVFQYTSTLTNQERFIQKKYYQDGMSVKDIIRVYYDYHLIKSESTIRKILTKNEQV